MKGLPEDRAVRAAEYIVMTRSTVRATAKRFGVSKSTIHKDVSERLSRIDGALYKEVKQILEQNKQERHLRGGEATKRKYEKQRMETKVSE